jgi:hypothetical protein
MKQTPALIKMTSLGEGRADFPQAHTLTRLGACPMQFLCQRYSTGVFLYMALPPFALSRLTALAFAGTS